MTSFAQVKAAHRPREKRVVLVLDGALLAEHEALSAHLADALAARRTSLGDPGPIEIARQVADVESRIAEATCEFVVVGIGRNAYRQLQLAHTTDDSLDMDTYIPALLSACIREPDDVDVPWLMEHLSIGQIDELFGAAFNACREADRVPFNQLASAQIHG